MNLLAEKFISRGENVINKFLFLDFESGFYNSICSAGYVLTDTNFTLLAKEDLICNPEAPLFKIPKNSKKHFSYAYSPEVFKSKGNFTTIYKKLYKLLNDENTIVFGFSFENDLNFLLSTLDRYRLNKPNFTYYDVQDIFFKLDKSYPNRSGIPSLGNLNHFFNTGLVQNTHKSDDDAFMTMKVFENILKTIKMSFTDVVNLLHLQGSTFKDFEQSVIQRAQKNFDELKEAYNQYRQSIHMDILKHISEYLVESNKDNKVIKYYTYPIENLENDALLAINLIYNLSHFNYKLTFTPIDGVDVIDNVNFLEQKARIKFKNKWHFKGFQINKVNPYVTFLSKIDPFSYYVLTTFYSLKHVSSLIIYINHFKKFMFKYRSNLVKKDDEATQIQTENENAYFDYITFRENLKKDHKN